MEGGLYMHQMQTATLLAAWQTRMYRALQGRMHRHEQPSLAFICEEDIRAVWTNPETRPLWELGHLLRWTKDDLSFVQSRLMKTLSLLVWINFRDWDNFNRFYLRRQSGVTDDALPIEDHTRLSVFFPDDPAVTDQFMEKQYIFLPIKVAEDDDGVNQQSRWSEYHRLPSISSVPMGSGTSGVVTKELIAARHIRLVDGLENSHEQWWACKRIRGTGDPNSVAFDTETENQRRFKESLTRNRNIMLSFATIIRGPDLCIFSKLADCNLFELLTGKCDSFSRYCSTVTPLALIQEAYCLVGALRFLHHGLDTSNGRMLCAHMDLKPENILVTWRNRRPGKLPVGLWQITDFGISRIKWPKKTSARDSQLSPMPLGNMVAQVAGLEMTPTAAVRGSGAFQAPEVGGNSNKVVGQESDMWSFGCILATVLAFASGGPAEVAKLYIARDHGDQDYFYDTKFVNGREEPCEKRQVVDYFNSLEPNDLWMSSSKTLVKSLLRIGPRYRWKAEETQSKLQSIFREGSQTGQGGQLCSWLSQFPAPVELAGRELSETAGTGQQVPFFPSWESPASDLVSRAPNFSLRQASGPLESALQDHIQEQTSRELRTDPIMMEPGGLEPVQREVSRRSSHSSRKLQMTPNATSPGTTDGSPKPSFTSTSTPRTLQERLDTVLGQQSLFVKLERPSETKKSRLCPSAKRIVYVSDTLLRVYDLDFLAEARRWEKEKLILSARTIFAADIPSASQGSITRPEQLQFVATSIAGDFIAVLLKAGRDRQHEVHLYKFSASQPSYDIPRSTCELQVSEQITGPLHDISVSTQGSLLAHLNNEIKLRSFAKGNSLPRMSQVSPRGSIENGVLPDSQWITLQVTGQVQDAAFSHDGSWIYAWSRDKGLNYWYIWRASTGQNFIRGNSKFGTDGVHGTTANFIIPFLSSPFFLACDKRGVLTMIGGFKGPGKCHKLRKSLPGVTAAAVAPEENAIIIVRKIQGQAAKHELSILHLPQDLSTCNLEDDFWSSCGQIREVFRLSGALSVSRSSGVYLLGSSSDGTLERRLIAR